MKRTFILKSILHKSPGIYIISCTKTNKVYIGETINLSQRIQKHFSMLRKNKHSNVILQNIFNKYGENSMTVSVLQYLNTKNDVELKIIEQSWQKKFKNCISLDSNEIFHIERNEEWRLSQKRILDANRDKMLKKWCTPILIYDTLNKTLTEYPSLKEASKFVERKHIQKNIYNNILTLYKNRYVAFLKKTFTEEKLNDILNIGSNNTNISKYMGEYNCYNLLSGIETKFSVKRHLIEFLGYNQDNWNIYNSYNNKIDFNFNCINLPKSIEELYNYDIEIYQSGKAFSTICNFKDWYNALKSTKNNIQCSKICKIDRKKIGLCLKQRSKEEWINKLEAAIARVKSI